MTYVERPLLHNHAGAYGHKRHGTRQKTGSENITWRALLLLFLLLLCCFSAIMLGTGYYCYYAYPYSFIFSSVSERPSQIEDTRGHCPMLSTVTNYCLAYTLSLRGEIPYMCKDKILANS